MSSTSANAQRRRPQQERAAQRREKFLEVAARLFGESGFEAVTMTQIAGEAQASIGTLYDYFPDKQSLALTLMDQYAEESNAYWAKPLGSTRTMSKNALAELFIQGILTFVRDRPAYLALLWAPVPYTRSAAARHRLRKTIADGLQRTQPRLSADRAFLTAQVIVELLKGLLSVYKQAAPGDRETVAEEFKKLMRLYLAEALA